MEIKFQAPHAIDAMYNLTHWLISTQHRTSDSLGRNLMGFGVDSSLMFEPLKMIICVRDRVDGVIERT